MPTDVLTTPPPPSESSPAETPKAPSAQDIVRSIEKQHADNLQQIRMGFGPMIADSLQNLGEAQKDAARFQRDVVGPAAERYTAPRATPPIPVAIPQPPVRDISPRPFMDNPQAKDTLGNVVSLLGLMAQTAMAGKAPVAALNAFSGAMTGWAEGDRVRAQRDWQQYLATVDQIQRQNDEAMRHWSAAMQEHGANELAAKVQYVVAMDQAGMKERATEAARHNVQDFLKMQQEYIGQADKLRDFTLNANKYLLDHEQKVETQRQNNLIRQQNQQRLEQELQNHKEKLGIDKAMLGLRTREVSLKEKEAAGGMAGLAPEERQKTVTWLAEKLNQGEDVSQLVRGFGGKSSNLFFEVQNEARRMAEASGDPATIAMTSRRILQANNGALRDLTKKEAEFKTWLTTFEKTVTNTKALVDKVEKSGMPVWDRKLLWLEAKVNGNVDANNLLAQMEIISRELDRVVARGRGVGSVRSQEAAREISDPGLSSEQFHGLLNTVLTPDALNAAMGFSEQRKELIQAISNPLETARKSVGGGTPAPPPPGFRPVP